MSTTFSVNRDQILLRALRICSAFDPTNPPSTDDMDNLALAFNMMIKEWIIDIPMWKIETVTLPLVANTNTYQIGPFATGTGALVMDKILRIQQASIRNETTDSDTPIDQLSIQEYEQYSVKGALGVVNSMIYRPLDDKTGESSYIQVYPTPSDATYSLRLVCLTQLDDVNIGTDPLDFPQECYIALSWNLADEVSFEYSVPLDRAQVISQRARDAKNRMIDWSQENSDSIRMMYDKRNA